MSISLEQLQAFVATVEQKGMAQAARYLGKHVSTVREQVNNLEIDTGLTLFTRHARSLEITGQGEQLYRASIAMLKEAAHFDARVDSLVAGVPDRLTIAIDISLLEPALDQLIAHILEQYPYLTLKVLNGDTMQIRAWLLSGQVDIGLMFGTLRIADELSVMTAYNFDVIRVVPNQWELPQPASDRDLVDKLQLSLSFLQDLGMGDADIVSHRYMLCNNATQFLNLLKAGVGWGHLPSFICHDALASGEVIQNQAPEDVFAGWHVDLAWLKTTTVNPAMKMFINGVQELPNR